MHKWLWSCPRMGGKLHSGREGWMQGIRFNHWAGKSRTKAAIAHLPLDRSTRAAISACGKKQPFGLLAATLHPLLQAPSLSPKLFIIQPPHPFNTQPPLCLYMPKRLLYHSSSAHATNLVLCLEWLFPSGSSELGLQIDSHGCAPGS